MKRFLKTLLTLLVLAGIAYGGYYLYQQQKTEAITAPSLRYTPVGVTNGSISQEVISTGSLTIAQTATWNAPAALTLDSVQVKTGQQIAAGDPLATVDTASLDTAIYTLQTELEAVDDTLVSLAASYESQQTLYTPIKGRVKELYGFKGDRVQDVVAEHGCLYVLSLDGKMSVEIPVTEGIALGERLTVTNAAENVYSAAVTEVKDETVTLTFSDLAANPGETVTVLLPDDSTITAQCAIHMPLEVSSTVQGVITTELLRINKYCDKKDSAFVVSYLEPTQEYRDTLAQRTSLVEQLATLRALKADPVLRADQGGIVSGVTMTDGQTVARDEALMTLYVGMPDQMTISVDELDIIHVQTGQSATVSMDAITDKTYNATVTYISTLGTASSGITGYDVTIQLEADEQLKLGMNGTVTIAVGQQENVLLVPLAALQSDARGSYVWLYSPDFAATEEEPGVKTYVNTGLSNEDHAAVTGGLRAGDQVLVVRSAATTNNTDQQGGTGMQLPGSDMQIPGGMTDRPEGGFTRPGSGTGTGGSGGGRTNQGGSGGSGGGRTAPGGTSGN
ncbi:MAG: HlyD family efflux transporter periplasmic adaptor subunit [Oscillospiraceae bacterium]|nr:HlyD family efflux transporter periplasmic adaptor subunit [Oscillospiraceae bacterium]